jgi:hypothetical protein
MSQCKTWSRYAQLPDVAMQDLTPATLPRYVIPGSLSPWRFAASMASG